MKICVVTHNVVRSDGQGRVNYEIAAAMAERGHEVHVVASRIDRSLLTSANLRPHWVAPTRLPGALLGNQHFARAAGRALRRLPTPDVLLLNGAIVFGQAAQVNVAHFVHADWLRSPWHPVRGRPTGATAYQYLYTRLNVAWERRAFARARHVVAVSGQVREALIRHAAVPAGKITVIEPGVDTQQFRPLRPGETNALRAELKVNDSQFLLLFVGDLRSGRKNLDLVLKAMTALPAAVHLAVIGDAAASRYPAMAERLGLGSRTHFLGRRTHDLPALVRGSDAFVFPSHYDPFALVVTEAMASGVPVVTCATVGASALIVPDVNGCVIENGNDPEPLERLIRRLRADPEWQARLAAAGRATAERHSWTAMVDRYEQLFQGIVKSQNA